MPALAPDQGQTASVSYAIGLDITVSLSKVVRVIRSCASVPIYIRMHKSTKSYFSRSACPNPRLTLNINMLDVTNSARTSVILLGLGWNMLLISVVKTKVSDVFVDWIFYAHC